MIVAASALLAILLNEPDAERLADRLDSPLAVPRFDAFMDMAALRIEPVTVGQSRLARLAFAEFGKGRHRDRLHLGGCFAYALAKETGPPLLFKGQDVALTDLEPAL